MLQTQTTSGGVEPQGTRRSALINFDPQAGGIKVIKIYGKLGRRIRAKERLEAQIKSHEEYLDTIKNKTDRQAYIDRNSIQINRIKQELAILNSRI